MNKVDDKINKIRNDGLDRISLFALRYLSWKTQFHRLVRTLPRPLSHLIFHLVKSVISWKVVALRRIYPKKYTSADPYKYISVDPNTIAHTTGEIFSKRRGWVVDGEWDRTGEYYMERTFSKAIRQRFVDDLPWEKTVLAERYEKPKFDRRITAIEQLYRNIRDNGYKSQRQLLEEDPEAAWGGLNDAMHPLANEIAVDIGRNGEPLWNICGQHRLAIAKILEIDRIPVQVFRRHSEWQDIRDRARRGEDIPEEFRDHPDLADIIEKR